MLRAAGTAALVRLAAALARILYPDHDYDACPTRPPQIDTDCPACRLSAGPAGR